MGNRCNQNKLLTEKKGTKKAAKKENKYFSEYEASENVSVSLSNFIGNKPSCVFFAKEQIE